MLLLIKTEIIQTKHTHKHTGKHENKGQKWKLKQMAYL